jgi:protein phosphatase
MRISSFGHTDIGRKRAFNEDSFLTADLSGGAAGVGPIALFIVADGIGGHAGGEVASALAVETVNSHVVGSLKAGPAAENGAGILEEAFTLANDVVFRRAAQGDQLTGMGTTLVAALIAGGHAYAANVGDSRLYHIRGETCSLISRDHSWTAEQFRLNLLSAHDISRSPFRNMVTRSIGFSEAITVDTFDFELQEGDGLLLCTDGLHGPLPEKDILRLFGKKKDPEEICRDLVQAADKAGSRDNITAVVVRILGDGVPGPGGIFRREGSSLD